ncbi:MAG: tRNA adenosine deaminase-associated protein [Angustibacter sp.]
MSYFSAVICRNGSGWRALDVDLEDLESLDEVGDHLRAVANGGPVLAVLEREDEWFALIRVDDDNEPRVFVSDLDATQRSHYAEMLAPVGDVELEEYADLRNPSASTSTPSDLGDDTVDDPADVEEHDDGDQDPLMSGADDDLAAAAIDPELPPAWAGDPGLLEDVGVEASELVDLVLAAPSDPGSVVADLGERCGFDELIEALR